jgi:hypothetical protein
MEALGVSCQIGCWTFHLGDVLSLSRASVVSLEGTAVLKAAGLSSLLEQRYSPPNKHQFGAGLGQAAGPRHARLGIDEPWRSFHHISHRYLKAMPTVTGYTIEAFLFCLCS